MKESNKYFEEDVPSQRLNLINQIKNHKILRLVRYSTLSPEDAAGPYEIPHSSLFRLTNGPLLMTLESGLTIGFASLPELVSITLWVEETESGEHGDEIVISEDSTLLSIDSCDPVYSEKSICQLIGKQVVRIKLLKRRPKSARVASRPCEAGIIFEVEGGFEFILSHGLHNYSDDFAIIYKHELLPYFMEEIEEIII
ncbi:hypothetical protein QUB56_29520 [Microcoleus sp. AR_TQ3_B6]|uniref:hypothetical protein n=1 Tax=Microcoleus sp. AR_TQ3_B6 TaxID=3055284 RepID=UPI002FD51DD5